MVALKNITREYLILTSLITPERIQTEVGCYELPSSGVTFVPSLNDKEREILADFWRKNAGVTTCYGISDKVSYDLNDFGPWWWLPTGKAVVTMCQVSRFTVMDWCITWNGNAITLLLSHRF